MVLRFIRENDEENPSIELSVQERSTKIQDDFFFSIFLKQFHQLRKSFLSYTPQEDIQKILKLEKLPRLYQLEVLEYSFNGQNSLINLPTGAGKTFVSAILISFCYHAYQKAKTFLNTRDNMEEIEKEIPPMRFVFINPTNVLVTQQYNQIKESLRINTPLMPTAKSNVQITNAGKFLYWLQKGLIDISQFQLVIFDEVHHIKKDHPYSIIARYWNTNKIRPIICGLTASFGVGANQNGIEEIARLLSNFPECKISTVKKNVEELKENVISSSLPIDNIMVDWNVNDTKFGNAIIHAMDKIVLLYNFDNFLSQTSKSDASYSSKLAELEKKFDSLNDRAILQKMQIAYLKKYHSALKLFESIPLVYVLFNLVDFHRDRLSTTNLKEIENNFFLIFKEFIQSITEQLAMNTSPYKMETIESFHGKVRRELEIDQLLPIYCDLFLSVPFNLHEKSLIVEKLENILSEQYYLEKEKFRAIIIVPDKVIMEALAFHLENNGKLNGIFSVLKIAGQSTTQNVKGVKQTKQVQVMDDFDEGKSNILIGTDIIQEGVNIQDCNTVICYQYIGSDIGVVQTKGRCRKDQGRIFFIYSGKVNDKAFNKRLEEIMHASQALELLNESDLFDKMKKQMSNLLKLSPVPPKEERLEKSNVSVEGYSVSCRHCSRFICKASEIKLKQSRYVVPGKLIEGNVRCDQHMLKNGANSIKLTCKDCPNEIGIVTLEKIPVICEKIWSKLPFSFLQCSDEDLRLLRSPIVQ
ncbi:hypothetical protein SNEBB_005433 [Seison nebaliae]|nr:hypothetical protein SNEBB_005433 [Seison nebaliae]